MKCDACNGTGYIKIPVLTGMIGQNCSKCDGQGRYDENNCRKPIDRYGVTKYCDRPKDHKGSCMTWNEYVNSNNDSNSSIPAGD